MIWSQAVYCSLAYILIVLLRRVYFRESRPETDDRNGADHKIYGLDHGRLNITLPPPSMWMNVGYWKVASEFPAACRALLDEVLLTANLMAPYVTSPFSKPCRALTIIDLGFGCGDQTVYLTQRTFANIPAVEYSPGQLRLPFIDRYVGVTLNRTQFEFAKRRLNTLGMLSNDNNNSSPPIEIFHEDAARPASWSEELDEATKTTPASLSRHRDVLMSTTLRDKSSSKTWVLALDSLCHFSPSREPIFNHTYHELNASLMAFDFMLADDVSIFDRALLILVSLFMGTPPRNFLTAAQYHMILLSAGYAETNVEFRDVSEHVFAPLARFLSRRERDLSVIGSKIGRFRFARWVFWWWGKNKNVRGVIVVARK